MKLPFIYTVYIINKDIRLYICKCCLESSASLPLSFCTNEIHACLCTRVCVPCIVFLTCVSYVNGHEPRLLVAARNEHLNGSTQANFDSLALVRGRCSRSLVRVWNLGRSTADCSSYCPSCICSQARNTIPKRKTHSVRHSFINCLRKWRA